MNRQNLRKVVVLALMLCSVQLHGRAFGASYVTFDIPDSSPNPNGINPSGEVVGYYFDPTDHFHSFFRTSDGSLTTFDPPGGSGNPVGSGNAASAVTPSGVIVGSYTDANDAIHGYLRASNGAFTEFDAPGSTFTSPEAINPSGQITGAFNPTGSQIFRGFVRSSQGTFTTFDAPNATYTNPVAINPIGAVTGLYLSPGAVQSGFVRSPNGAITTFTVNGMSTQPVAINPEGEIAGNYTDPNNGSTQGFLRTNNGKVVTFEAAPDDFQTIVAGITPSGEIVGWVLLLSGADGFVRSPKGDITLFSVPGSDATFVTAVSVNGAVTGNYLDASGAEHGFIRLPGNDPPDPMAFALAADLPALTAVPEPSIWAMMLLGFVGLGYAGYRRTRCNATLAA